ncbi:hypothetical protein N566_07570 [Streptomycetaceae bacterium MP113-05]|nr:hypothetical protein N566_07570 [Streptomycetaceae bacterium MP113-05]
MRTTELGDLHVRPGAEVILPGFGGIEVAEQVRRLGAVPVIVDVDPRSYCIDPISVDAAVTPRTEAVVAVPLFGHPAPTAALVSVTGRHGVRLEEVGPCLGPCTEPAPLEVAARRRNAAYVNTRLRGVVPPAAAGRDPGGHMYSAYVVRVPGNGRPDRDAYLHALRAKGVNCRVPVRTAVHRAPGFRTGTRLPEAERAVDECLALSLGPSLTKRELHRVVSACNSLGGLVLDSAC